MQLSKFFSYAIISITSALSATSLWASETLKFAHVYEITHPLHKGALQAAEQIKKETEGRIKIEVFPASSLGKEAALNEALSLGTVDIIYTGAAFAGTSYGPIAMADYPFTLMGYEHWKAYRDSKLFKEIAKGYEQATGGNKAVAINYYGARHVTANKAILTPADMKGLKIRVPNAPAYLLFPKAIGANPTPMAFAEVYLALQQGVVDAQENPLPTIQSKKFYEVQSNINLTGHIINSVLTIISPTKLASLSKEDREIVMRALKNSAAWTSDEIAASEKSLAEWFKKQGVNVNFVDRKPFIEAVKPALTKKGMPFSPKLYERLQTLISKNEGTSSKSKNQLSNQ